MNLRFLPAAIFMLLSFSHPIVSMENERLSFCKPGKRAFFCALNTVKCGLNVGLVEAVNSLPSVMDSDAVESEVSGALTTVRAMAWADFGLSLVQLGGQVVSLVRGSESEAPEKLQMAGSCCSCIPWLAKMIALGVVKPSFNDSAVGKASWNGIFALSFFSDPDLAVSACFLAAQGD